MTSQWTPPPNGSPCWIQILAKDVQRAKQFYSTVFDWNFKNESVHNNPTYSPEQIARFHFPGNCPGGGITKVQDDDFVASKGRGGVVLHLHVDSLERYTEKIISAGGSKISEPEAESEHGTMQAFEDTEGNYFGLYAWNAAGVPASPVDNSDK